MVGLFKALPALLFATLAAADLQITIPSSSEWWVAKSVNVMAWTCQDSPVSNFTVLINNQDAAVLAGPLAIIAVQNNLDCSVIVSQNQVNLPASTGYTLIFSNPLNNTEVFATSQPFEIKPFGSMFPTSVHQGVRVKRGST